MAFIDNANPEPVEAIVRHLGIPLGKAPVGRFSDGEIQIEIQESMRDKHVLILQFICASTNDNLMELMVMVDVLKCTSACRITAAVLYFDYARQDRRPRSARVAVTAKVVANMLEVVGVERVLTMDLHVDQIQDFLDIPVDNIYALPILLEGLRKKNHKDPPVISLGVDGVACVRALAKQLSVGLTITDKCHPKASVTEVMNIVGEVDGHNYAIMDDTIGTDGTLCKVAQVLKERDAKQMFSYCTHPVLLGGAAARIADSVLNKVVVTDTIPLREDVVKCGKTRQPPTAPLLAKIFTHIMRGDSIMSLFAE